MNLPKIYYQSFCWVIGTTSFRTAQLNLKIEQQLLLLEQLQHSHQQDWYWNTATQIQLYELMHRENFLTGTATRKDKDARQKTSGLVDIGLITENRLLTEAGKALLSISKNKDYAPNNTLQLEKDSYIYFKQLLKTSIKVNQGHVKPYFILSYVLDKLKELHFEEFCYFLPLCTTQENTIQIVENIQKFRQKTICLYDIIFMHLMSMNNYQVAHKIFLENPVDEHIICTIGLNRKSAHYDKPYFTLYNTLQDYFIHHKKQPIHLLNCIKKTKQHKKWRQLIFGKHSQQEIQKSGTNSINPSCPFLHIKTKHEFKETFFKYLHTFKAMATLEDYFDLNRRYFGLSNTIIFKNNKITFDLLPSYFFRKCHEWILEDAFSNNQLLYLDVEIAQINPIFKEKEQSISTYLSKDFGISIQNNHQIQDILQKQRINRLNQLINERFTKNTLLQLLSYFEQRKDEQIKALVTEDADIPTIFEYILAIIWYEISERQGDILNYMNLSLSAELLPKSHAMGGTADIVYVYEACKYYPKHSLLLEATLAESTNQRRMEMEPVSRHLGEHLIKSKNILDYCIFITTFLHRNVIGDFRARKHMIYYGNNDAYIEGMKIIPMDTEILYYILKNNISYKNLYPFFEQQYQSHLNPKEWYENLKNTIQTIKN